MVSKLLGAVSKKYTTVSEAAIVISIFTLFAQLLGVVRDRLFAHFLGPGKDLDIYLTAFRIPDFLYVLLSTLISATVLIPLLSKGKNISETTNLEENSGHDVNTLFTVFFVLTCFLSILIFFFMPLIATFIAPGFDAESTTRLIFLSRIMLLSPILLATSNFIGSINQYYKKFFAYAMAPVFYNIGLIIGVALFYNYFGIVGLGFGVVCGALLHLSTQLVGYASSGYKLAFIRVKKISILKDVLKLSIPRTLTLALFNLLFIVIIAIASGLTTGSISLLTFAFNIALVPLALVGIPFATASFPYLVSIHKTDMTSFRQIVERTSVKITFWTVAMVVSFIIFRAHIVRIILGTKLFSWNDTKITAALVFVILTGVVFQAISHFFIRVYYAQGQTKKPFYIVLTGFLITVFLLLVIQFIPESNFSEKVQTILRVKDATNARIILLTISYTLGAICTSILFVSYYQKETKHRISLPILKEFLTSLLHGVVLAFLFKVNLYLFEALIKTNTFLGVLLQAGLSFGLGSVLWFVYLYFVKSPHIEIISSKLKLFFNSHKFILEENQDL